MLCNSVWVFKQLDTLRPTFSTAYLMPRTSIFKLEGQIPVCDALIVRLGIDYDILLNHTHPSDAQPK
ncbi:uncharacterized protein PHALS_04363 [Plasmopara halstedii]|uniref:Uncharacterized protein n=1 Tax=Plasmopara halstedii TaxID=4781 RepID=A0A0P1B235_PLAHL|nr:uncharacterized protein PHALS_04363 [Plasmopara halstedii]CEG47492.1 hypothetical protein PHALS_04363 [Plasmopara halstedii]|eukprot:XP_024583861.1 hypothetical protein PHALS_04363 [Plasmopara halstedii]